MMVTQFQKFLLISRLTSFYFTFIVDYSLAFHRISDPFRTLQKQICIEERPKEIYPATEFSPLKSNKRSWSKTRVHFVLVKVHERHYEQKRDVFDARFEFVPPILIKHREESTDVYL